MLSYYVKKIVNMEVRRKKKFGQKQVLLNHICSSQEERYLAGGRQTNFKDDGKEWFKKILKKQSKTNNFSSDLIIKKVAKKAEKTQKSIKCWL